MCEIEKQLNELLAESKSGTKDKGHCNNAYMKELI